MLRQSAALTSSRTEDFASGAAGASYNAPQPPRSSAMRRDLLSVLLGDESAAAHAAHQGRTVHLLERAAFLGHAFDAQALREGLGQGAGIGLHPDDALRAVGVMDAPRRRVGRRQVAGDDDAGARDLQLVVA